MWRCLDDFLVIINSLLIVLSLSPEVSQVHIGVTENFEPLLDNLLTFQQSFLCSFKVTSLKAEGSELGSLKSNNSILFVDNGILKQTISLFLSLRAKQPGQESLALSCSLWTVLRLDLGSLFLIFRLFDFRILLHKLYCLLFQR